MDNCCSVDKYLIPKVLEIESNVNYIIESGNAGITGPAGLGFTVFDDDPNMHILCYWTGQGTGLAGWSEQA